MLLRALVLVTVVAVLATTILEAGAAMARAATHRAAERYAAAGFAAAAGAIQREIASAIAAGSDPSGPFRVPSPLPTQCATTTSPCDFILAEQVVLATATPLPVRSPSTGCDATVSNCSSNVQEDSHVRESRVATQIAVTVSGAGGAPLVTRVQDVTLRTFASAPFVAVASTRDATLGGLASDAAPGDDGGIPPETAVDPCTSPSPGATPTADGTVVTVVYVNDANGACAPGGVWASRPLPSFSDAPVGWSP